MVSQIEKAETRMKQEMDSREKLLEDFAVLNEQLNSTERERIDSMVEHDNITKYRLEREQLLQKTKTELTKAQQRCLELDAKLTTVTEKSESLRKERDHAKEQWRVVVKERKKLQREIASTVLARDQAIQKCFSTNEDLGKMKESYNRLLNRLASAGQASSDSVSTCSSKDCHFCSSQDWTGSLEVRIPVQRMHCPSKIISFFFPFRLRRYPNRNLYIYFFHIQKCYTPSDSVSVPILNADFS